MRELNARNTETVEQALKDLSARLYDQADQGRTQQRAIAALAERIASLERTVAWQQARLVGLGPTVV